MNIRNYNAKEAIVFRKTTEPFGGLSNMASGYALYINEVIIPSSEHLYQAMRYPTNPEIQFEIINQDNAMKAKMISNKYKAQFSRPDWEKIQIKVMRWALEIKLAQNWDKFSTILKETQNKSIVEYATDNKIWGAKPINNDELVGVNALGRLLMELREKYISENNRIFCVNPPDVPALLLYNQHIDIICDDMIIDYHNESLLEDSLV
ncbi:NADAR family protein [Flavobacterium luminosum]|uniref:NADAR family protein n=1 Tax=Flavobacterium luminosum TaxID=2949086 RepID=A0ABT0TRB7_9FLAO|nr:NADAR family protein [Flavobacterium sp. HXWNR70]MCL9810041.1 NADAR family protein [Flavobacterium sp. HXWNR70]